MDRRPHPQAPHVQDQWSSVKWYTSTQTLQIQGPRHKEFKETLIGMLAPQTESNVEPIKDNATVHATGTQASPQNQQRGPNQNWDFAKLQRDIIEMHKDIRLLKPITSEKDSLLTAIRQPRTICQNFTGRQAERSANNFGSKDSAGWITVTKRNNPRKNDSHRQRKGEATPNSSTASRLNTLKPTK